MIIHLFDFVKGAAPLGKPPSGKKADSRLAEEGLSFSDFLGADQRPRRGRSAGKVSLVQREVARRYIGAPAKAQRKRVWWGEEVRRRERDLPRLSGARRGIHSPHRRDGGIDRLTLQSQACQPGGDATRWGFLLSGQKEPKSA